MRILHLLSILAFLVTTRLDEAWAGGVVDEGAYVLFESDPVRPLALSPGGDRLFAVNIPDGRLEIFAVEGDRLVRQSSVPVGLEPVAVAVASDKEVWVVNQLSDSISIVDVEAEPPRVVRTLLVGDEPRDIVFGGPGRRRAFITTAHRGQNSAVDPQLSTPGIGRADVWVFDADALGDSLAGQPRAILNLFGDTPRALAVSPDGATVYAAVFKSGNRTTTISAFAVCDGGESAAPCRVQGRDMPGGLPAPNVNSDGDPQPRTGLIVKYEGASGAWLDSLRRDWRNAVAIDLPDYDLFRIDASAETPVAVGALSGVGTVIYSIAVNPTDGHLFVANTEARNEVRFEPQVRGHLHESRVTVIDGDSVQPRRLNKHIDYGEVPSPEGVASRSLAIPAGIVVGPDGKDVWIAGFGSGGLQVLDRQELESDTFQPSEESFVAVRGGGPIGPLLTEDGRRLFVLTRFDNAVSVIDVDARREIAHVPLFDPEPESIRRGRRFFYDARLTSSNGESSCASCHVFGDNDALAWDLGDPTLPVAKNPNPLSSILSIDPRLGTFFKDFHPLKGPLTTQTLRGLAGHSPMHWRGDRTGAYSPEGNAHDDLAALRQFNGAFVRLMGRATTLPETDMDDLSAFLLRIVPPPNPIRGLDNSLNLVQRSSRDEFFREIQSISCATCHSTDAEAGRFGTNLLSSVNGQSAQMMKVPSLRQTYQKVGMFGMFPHLDGFMSSGSGDQVRGFGFLHDGATGVFIERTFDYVMAFETNLAPIVGQQITLTADNAPIVEPRIDLLIARAAAGECDLVVKGVVGSEPTGWLRTPSGDFQADDSRLAPIRDESLRLIAKEPGQALTYLCAPPGTGRRLALDRDGDGFGDADERRAGSDSDDSLSTPAPAMTPTPTSTQTPTVIATETPLPPCPGDCDGNRNVSIDELRNLIGAVLGRIESTPCSRSFGADDRAVVVEDLVRAVRSAAASCTAG